MIVRMVKPRFEAPIVASLKIHTIRPRGRQRVAPGMELSLRVWTDKPYRSPQREILRTTVTEVREIILHRDGLGLHGGKFWSAACRRDRPHIERLAQDDGFDDWAEMLAWFEREHDMSQTFVGRLIYWRTPKQIEAARAAADV